MTSSLAIGKLIILYMIDRSEGPLSMPLISQFLLDRKLVNLLTLTRSYAELEESGLVRAENGREKTFLHMTEDGEEALSCFYGTIHPSLRRAADEYLTENGAAIREERDLRADYHRASGGGYDVRMEAYEKGNLLLGITLRVPDDASAEAAAEAWKGKSVSFYQELIEKLF